MGIKIAAENEYSMAIRDLFPQGEYWGKQFADPESDCSLFCKAKAALIVRIRKRMADLQKESVMQNADETLGDWERVLIGAATPGLDITRRRAALGASKSGNFNVKTIEEIGAVYGVEIKDVYFPFRSAFFGHSCFGTDRIASPAAFAVLFIKASLPDDNSREDFEKQIISKALSSYVIYFIYGGS